MIPIDDKQERRTAQRRRKAFEYKLRVIALLGGKCIGCGATDPRVLQVDHIHGAKESHQEYGRGGTNLYRQIVNGHKPLEDHQLLCANCNSIKRHERGETKHYKTRQKLRGN